MRAYQSPFSKVWSPLKGQQRTEEKHSMKYVLVVFTGIADKDKESLLNHER
jgi:hypothetical protein